MKIWNSKYALTIGIMEQYAERISTSMVEVDSMYYLHGEGVEWHLTRESAVARAKTMRDRKIANLRKQLARLESLTFNTTTTIV